MPRDYEQEKYEMGRPGRREASTFGEWDNGRDVAA
jgi:hypothetical protein